MSWQKDIGLEYCIKGDPVLTKDELRILMDLHDEDKDEYWYTDISKNKLLEKGFIEQYEDGIVLSEKGNTFMRSIKRRKELPKLNNVIECWKATRKQKGLTIKELSKISGVSNSKIAALEARLVNSPYRYSKYWCHIEDIYAIFACLELDPLTVIKTLKREEHLKEKYEKENNATLKKHYSGDYMVIPNKPDETSIEKEREWWAKKEKEIEREKEENDRRIERNNYKKDSIESDYKILISESPIETKLLKEIIKKEWFKSCNIETQKEFQINKRNYRTDIYLELKDKNDVLHKALIECDGHDFHEKTKEQAQKDKQRDRDFMSVGLLSIRFTGSEIWKNASKCADEIYSTLVGFQSAISL